MKLELIVGIASGVLVIFLGLLAGSVSTIVSVFIGFFVGLLCWGATLLLAHWNKEKKLNKLFS